LEGRKIGHAKTGGNHRETQKRRGFKAKRLVGLICRGGGL